MRCFSTFVALFLGSVTLPALAPEPAQACHRNFYGGAVSYQPGPFYPPCPARPPMVLSIGAYDDYFQPGTINVPPGTVIRFVNYGRHTHTVTSKDGQWDSGDLQPGYVYTARFVYPGTYYYYCRHHKGMQGTVVVGGGGYGPSGGYGGAGSSGY